MTNDGYECEEVERRVSDLILKAMVNLEFKKNYSSSRDERVQFCKCKIGFCFDCWIEIIILADGTPQ